MNPSSKDSPEESSILADEADRYFCPVCGIELAKSDFDTPPKHYYCPYCSTRQTPSLVGPPKGSSSDLRFESQGVLSLGGSAARLA
jgi:rubredoxin